MGRLKSLTSFVALVFALVSAASAASPTLVGDSLVFEAEDWTTPGEAWLADRDTEDRWNLWSKNASAGWSGGVVLRSPTIREDRDSAEAGAPPLHTRLEGIPAGDYEVVLSRTVRRLAVSLDGENWRSTQGNVEDSLGVFRIADGTFEFWIDDRYATPTNIGPGYFDYVRLDPFSPPKLRNFEVFACPDGFGNPTGYQIAWTSDRPVPTGLLEIERNGKFERLTTETGDQPKLRNHRQPESFFDWWKPRIKLRVVIQFAKEFEWASDPVELVLPSHEKNELGGARTAVDLTPAGPINPERPLLTGIPFERGQLWTTDNLVATDQAGSLPTQCTTSSRWPDGSVRWLFARIMARVDSSRIRLVSGTTGSAPSMVCADGLANNKARVADNGLLTWSWDDNQFALFDSVARKDQPSITGKPQLGNLRVIDGDGRQFGLGNARVRRWEEAGPVRSVLRVEGPFEAADGKVGLSYRLRYFFTSDSPLVRVQFTLINDADGPEFQRVRSLAMRIPIAGEGPLQGQLAGGESIEVAEAGRHEIRQIDHHRLRVIANGDASEKQDRSPGWGLVQRGDNEIALAIRDFWQTWPKSIALEPDGLHVRLLPDVGEDTYEAPNLMEWTRHGYGFDDDGCYLIRRGMALRHEFWVRFGRTGDVGKQGGPQAWAASVLSLPYAAASPEHYCQSGAFGPLQSAARDARPEYESMIERSFRAVLDSRETNGEYGWMNFGDWHGERTYNWGNNEYDLSWAMALQFARTGRWDYFALGQDMARHYATVDTIHAPVNQRMPGRVWAHCAGHVGVGERMPSKGPAAEALRKWLEADQWSRNFYRGMVDSGGHIYQEGNFACYFLTGDRDLYEAAEMVCTAQATYLTPKFDFGIERGAGWPLSNAVAAYESTGNPFYLNAARIYVERVLEKHDPIGGGWLLPQPASECDGQAGVGGKAFATGVLLYGLMRYDLVEPRQEVQDCIVAACRWLVEQTWNEEKTGFRYKTGCDKYLDNADSGTTTALCLPGLAYGYKLSGDERFMDVARKGLARLCNFAPKIGKAAGSVCRQSAFALPLMGSAGRGE